MNTNLTQVPATYPSSLTTDSNYLFNTLGFFWQRMFKDKKIILGMSSAQVDSVLQGYYKLVELINSYSCYNIPIFEIRRWYPLFVYKSSLNNVLMFGEDILFGDEISSTPYIFGRPVPLIGTEVSMIAPRELQLASIITDQIISPNNTFVNGTDFTLVDGRLTFNVSPFTHSNIPVQNVYNPDGTPSTFTYYDGSGTAHPDTKDQLMILWCYNASLDDNNLKYNIGYLFGLNVPNNASGKDVLISVLQNYTNGCTINDITNIALASLGLPLNTPAPDYVQLFDNVNTPEWWNSNLSLFHGDNIPLELPQTLFIGNYKSILSFNNTVDIFSVDSNAITSFPIQGNERDIVTFNKNISNPGVISSILNYFNPVLTISITDGTGSSATAVANIINDFPAITITNQGSNYSNSPTITITADTIDVDITTNVTVSGGHIIAITPTLFNFSGMINPVDFMFKSFLRTTTALLRIKFTDINQLGDFVTYFEAIKTTLPPQILLIVLCDFTQPNELVHLDNNINDSDTLTNRSVNISSGKITTLPLQLTNDIVHINGNSGFTINDMDMSRVFVSGILSGDLRNISITQSS